MWGILPKKKKEEKEQKKVEGQFEKKDYVMKDVFNAEDLVIGKLEYVSSDVSSDACDFGPICIKTDQFYIFEPIKIEGVINHKYKEVFTGFIAKTEMEFFDLPYIVDYEKLTDVLPDYQNSKIPKFGMLLALDEINTAVKVNEDCKKMKYQK